VTDREQINEALAWYCRGVDRLDRDAISRAFHPGALLIDYAPEPMPIEVFMKYAFAVLGRKFSSTQHLIGNVLITFLDDHQAMVETYVRACHVQPPDEAAGTGEQLHTFGGRYIDRFTKVRDEWRIAERTLRNDWSHVEPITAHMQGAWLPSGRAGSPDPIYA
jgi:hypothetical protein